MLFFLGSKRKASSVLLDQKQNILTDKRVNAISIGNTLNYSEHSVQKTKSPLTNNYFRQPCFQKII